VNLLYILGLLFVLAAAGLIIFFATARRNKTGAKLFRDIPAFDRIRKAIGLAVEAGDRLQVTLGWGNPLSTDFTSGLIGLTMLDRITRAASVSDRPPVATSGEGVLTILSQDTYRSANRALGGNPVIQPYLARMVGTTPFSYAAGTMPLFKDEQVSTIVAAGHFGPEIALIHDAADRKGALTVAGSENLSAQAVIYATAEEPLIGEEIYAGGAYLGAGNSHDASLRAQDILRMVVIGLLVVGSLARLFKLDVLILNMIPGLNP
jgi:hypothetical protein